jgi:hypothetical protein
MPLPIEIHLKELTRIFYEEVQTIVERRREMTLAITEWDAGMKVGFPPSLCVVWVMYKERYITGRALKLGRDLKNPYCNSGE